MKKLDSIKNSRISRGLFAIRSTARMLPSLLFADDADPREVLKNLIGSSVEKFVSEVGELKGSMLKAAQILSLYGEYYLPEEVNEVLKKVQSQTHYLSWEKIFPLIPASFHDELDIDKAPLAAASIGQVHRAVIKKTGKEIVLKIQYPGIRKAIDLDMKLIRGFLSLAKVLPKKVNLDPIYAEIRRVLIEEMDYELERKKHCEYQKLLHDVPGCYVPKLYPQFSTADIIASEFIEGVHLSGLSDLPQEKRNQIGETLFRLFLREIFVSNLIQTDSHPGNYLYRPGQVVLLDFGACLRYSDEAIGNYRSLIEELFHGNKEKFLNRLTAIAGKDGEFAFDPDLLWEYCKLAASPLQSEDFDWGETKLPDELYPLAMKLVTTTTVETPPHEFIFLDRKLLGLFSLLRTLGARFNVRALALEVIKEKGPR